MKRKTTRYFDFTDEALINGSANPFLVGIRTHGLITLNHEMGLNLILTRDQARELANDIISVLANTKEKPGG